MVPVGSYKANDRTLPSHTLCWVLQYVPVSPMVTEEDVAAVTLAAIEYFDHLTGDPR